MAQFEDVAESSLGDELLQSVEDANCGYVALGWLVEGPRSMFITPKVYERLGKPTEFTLDLMKGLKVRVPETDLMISTMDALALPPPQLLIRSCTPPCSPASSMPLRTVSPLT